MPVRSLNSVVLKWPDRDAVLAAARRWALRLTREDRAVETVLCVGSYARGDWGVGSDVDLIVRIRESTESSLQRRLRYEPTDLPVPSDVWVYTRAEWNELAVRAPHLASRLAREMLDLTAGAVAKRSAAMPRETMPAPGCAGLGHGTQPEDFRGSLHES